MGDPTTPPPSGAKRPAGPARPGLSEALRSLREATEALSTNAIGPTSKHDEATPPDHASSPPPDAEARAFYEHLERSGRLMNVTEGMDLSKLPPRMTHIRWPDGKIERIGFS